jgi:hypothetical protein
MSFESNQLFCCLQKKKYIHGHFMFKQSLNCHNELRDKK